MGVSENSVPLNPMVLLIIIPMKNGYFIGNINPTCSDKPICGIYPSSNCRVNYHSAVFLGSSPSPWLLHPTHPLSMSQLSAAWRQNLQKHMSWYGILHDLAIKNWIFTTKKRWKKHVFEVIFQLAMGIIVGISPWKEKESGNDRFKTLIHQSCGLKIGYSPQYSQVEN